MSKKEKIIEVIRKYKNTLEKLTSLYFFPDIPPKKQKNAMISHNLDLYEDILLMKDHTVWGSATESMVITEKCISMVSNDSEPPNKIEWSQITKVDFVHGTYYFFNEYTKEEVLKGEISSSLDSDDKYGLPFAKMLTEIAELTPNPEKILFDEIEKEIKSENYRKAIQLADEYEDKFADGTHNAIVAFNKSISYFYLEDYKSALNSINFSIQIGEEVHEGDDDKSNLTTYYDFKATIENSMGNYYSAIDNLLIAQNYAKVNKEKFEIQNSIKETYDLLKDSFSELPLETRKIIAIDKSFAKKLPTSFLLLLSSNLPDIAFPPGHPKEKYLYISHPHMPNVYKPIDTYETSLFLNRYYEFRYFLQCIGATKISIECLKGKSVEKISDDITKVGVTADVFIHSADVKFTKSSKSDSTENSSEYFSSVQKFSPIKEPHLPENLIWYKHEDSWQELNRQRMTGNLLTFNEVLSSKQSYSLSKNEMMKLSVEYEGLFDIKANISNNSNNFFKEEETIEWKISVTFAPLNTLVKNVEIPQIQNILENSETEYIDILKVTLEDGVITKDERRYLEKKQKDLKISASRAIELENMVKQKGNLSENEIKYADELKFIIKNNGKISIDERNILSKQRQKLNISDERALEIETIITNSNKKKGFFGSLFGK
jgi:tetratricopeptide (TPR) repeat protein